ncbi:tetratricopeptide repeat protein [Paludisphaera mucosa]|uniref:Tetratricopeptide repeat protein n=1 Tax=Paludisphaera mucosa TaxID=3030827 RepID=A0ABT6F673_9BACT|nr:tetratricopeptide repeat protein [Paludisphaera mucosa]MDG3002996.1 tetratricopeptide repeat protein [Paludisphaera mucosa]
MTVRWKPLLILSGLFVAVAVVGVIAISSTLAPPTAQSVLKRARSARDAGRLADAEIYYKQALQSDGRNAAVHEEFAGLYDDMIKAAPADRRDALRTERADHLIKSVRFDKNLKGPRLRLLQDAMADDVAHDAVYWARELATLDPENLDVAFVLASEALDSRTPNLAEVRKLYDRLAAGQAPEVRRLLIQARLAAATNDDAGRAAALAAGRKLAVADDAGPTELMAKLRLDALDVQNEADPAVQGEIVKGMVALSDRVLASAEPGSQRVTRLSYLLEQSQRSLVQQSQAKGDSAIDALIATIENQLASLFEKSRQAGDHVDYQIYLTYADHLRFRRQRDRCLQVVNEALGSPLAARPSSSLIVLGLHTVGAEMALIQTDDSARLPKAAPHIQALLAATEPRYQGLGHLFQGAVELEESGVVASATKKPDQAPVKAQPKLRASALTHLKAAAQQLPDVAEAQARYGVALVLNQEQGLGRQYLQNALKMSALDPQYEFWAAWTILQAGYPEEAIPIVDSLTRQLAQGSVPPEMKVVVHQLSGELYQARRGPGDLDRAAVEFEKVAKLGDKSDGGATLRLAQIDVQRKRLDEAMARIEGLRKSGQEPPAAENLAVLILEEQGKKDEARKRLEEARTKFPRSSEIAGLYAALKANDRKPEEADKALAEFLVQDPDNLTLTMMRAQILNDSLKRPDDARKLLSEIGERSSTSAPWLQLAQMEMACDNLDAAAAVIAKIRSRWKEGAAGDILEGQLALKRNEVPAAIAHFDEALKKDPENKIVAFWKAQLDGRSGAYAEATKALEDIVRDRPSKEVETGVTLLSAAQSALANLSLQNGNVDDAIRRFEELKRNNEAGALTRTDRWQLVTAHVARKQWPVAKAELAAMLNDPKNPPNPDERVRAANLYREHGEEPAAIAQLDGVLKDNPTNASAVVTRAYLFMRQKQHAQATALLSKAVEKLNQGGGKAPEVFFLMLAAVENETPPLATSPERTIKVVEEGLAAQPDSIPLVQAKYLILAKQGDPARAVEFVASKAEHDSKGVYRRMLVDVYRHQKNYEGAEKILRGLVAETPSDGNLAAGLVEVVSLAAADALAAGDADKLRTLDEKAAGLIRECRAKFPTNLAILQAECDQAARRGDFTQAVGITEEIDKVAKNSSVGPLLRARLFASQNRPADVARAYAEAVEREPRRLDVRVAFGKASLKLGNVDDALQQAKYVLDVEKADREGLLLQARALDASGLSDAQREAARSSAVTQLEAAVAADPKFVDALQTIAEIELKRHRRPAAINALKRALAADPADGTALAQYVQLLSEPDPASPAARPAGLDEAKRLAAEIAKTDQKGDLLLAVAVGFHKARRLELALPASEKAASLLDSPVAHLNLGDLLLSMAESQPDPAKGRPYFERAVEEYDRVLKIQPGSIEAVNNKAWVLHSSLGRSQEALELVQAILPRVNPAALPGEFFDTVGAIQESVGRTSDAEQSYLEGLKRSPDLAVLHYHYGRLIASDKARGDRAKDHLSKAIAAKDQLSPVMAEEAVRLVNQIDVEGR